MASTTGKRRWGPGGRFGLGGRAGDLLIVAVVVAVLALMIVPLRQWVLDLLIALNVALSLVVLTMALFVRRPLSFSVFPTLLLVATLYRLALNIASTRLILTEADAGRIIGAFGGIVMGEDILVGAVIFGILAIVLFVVITKGAERVAEVAARFTLDALPGMQLAIEADLRAGAITGREVSRRREELERRSHYYGSLDGAMKFVRGDAVASLVIIAVNILGGLGVGALRKGMSLADALDTYGRLTVGDGLVTMIPALLISTAAGLLVTRVGQDEREGRLGAQLAGQIFAEPRALLAAAVVLLILAVVPQLPAWPFLLMGALAGAAGTWGIVAGRRAPSREPGAPESGGPGLDETQDLVVRLAVERPVLVRETVPRVVSIPTLARMLGLMGEDGIGPEQLPELLEALAGGRLPADPEEAVEVARKRMSRVITARLGGAKGRALAVAVLDADVEAVAAGGVTRTGDGARLALPADVLEEIMVACDRALGPMEVPVLLVRPAIRRPLSRILSSRRPGVRVLAHGELEPGMDVRVVATVSVRQRKPSLE